MIHLFNKVYLRHETEYDSFAKSILLLSNAKDHPLVGLLNIPQIEAPTFDYVLQTYFDNNIEVFWDEMREKTERFDIFTDTTIMLKLAIQFWKSIFVNATVDSLYELLNFYMADLRLKSFIFRDISFERWKVYQDSHKFMTKEKFAELFEETRPSEVLMSLPKDNLSFEFLLADSYFNPNSKYKGALLDKVKNLAWKTVFHDIEDIKSEIFNGIYDIKKMVPHVEVSPENLDQLEQIIYKEPSLRWLVDEKIENQNIDYVRNAYDKETFLTFFRHLGFPEDYEFVVRMKLAFDGKYEEYLDKDIRKGFGSAFTGDTMRQKANQLLTSYIYDRIRSGKTEELKKFELR